MKRNASGSDLRRRSASPIPMPEAVGCAIASWLTLGEHVRLTQASRWWRAVCGRATASPVTVALPRSSYADPGAALRHYRPRRLTCWIGDATDLGFLRAQTRLHDLVLLSAKKRADRAGDKGASAEIRRRPTPPFAFLAHLPELRSLRTDVGSWRDTVREAPTAVADGCARDRVGGGVGGGGNRPNSTTSETPNAESAAAAALAALYLTDLSPAHRSGPSDMRWLAAAVAAARLHGIELLHIRDAPRLSAFRGAGACGARLRVLSVGGIDVRKCNVSALQQLPNLRRLRLDAYSAAVRFSGLERLPSSLRQLELRTSPLASFDAITHLTDLTRLAVACGDTLGADQLVPLAAAFGRRLRRLEIERCRTVRSLAALAGALSVGGDGDDDDRDRSAKTDTGGMTRLERLVLNGAHMLGDCGALARLPRLRALTLIDAPDISVVAHCRRLAFVHIAFSHVMPLHSVQSFVDRLLLSPPPPPPPPPTSSPCENSVVAADSGDDALAALPSVATSSSPPPPPPPPPAIVIYEFYDAGERLGVRVPASGSSYRVMGVRQYDSELGAATHAGQHSHALHRRAPTLTEFDPKSTSSPSCDGDAKTTASVDAATEFDWQELTCDRCARTTTTSSSSGDDRGEFGEP